MKHHVFRCLITSVVLSLLAAGLVSAQSDEVSGTLSFYSWQNEGDIGPLLDAFLAEYPNVELDFSHVPPVDPYVERLNLLAGSGELPDLFNVTVPVTIMAENGFVSDITDMQVVQDLSAGFQQSYAYDGRVYAYNPTSWIGGNYYNIALFRDNDIDVPTTLDEFLAASQAFQDLGIIPMAFEAGNLADMVYWIHNTEVVTQDPTFNDRINTGEATFAEGYLDAFNWFKTEMVDTGFVTQDMVALTGDQRLAQFVAGEAAMYSSGSWAIGQILEANPDMEVGWFPFVGSTPDRILSFGATNPGFAINPDAENRPAAEAFINFLGSPEGLAIYQEITGGFIGVKGVNYEIHPVMEPAREVAEAGAFYFPPIFWTDVWTLHTPFVQGTQEIVMGVVTPEELVAQLDEINEDLMEDN